MTIYVPQTIIAGDTIVFDVPAFTDPIGNSVDSGTYALHWYARTTASTQAADITGVAESSGWRVTVPYGTTSNFSSGLWTWQAIASTASVKYTAGRGQFNVKVSLEYSGSAGKFDDRSRAAIDLEYVDDAIRTLAQGGVVQEYTIGNRSLRRYKMSELLALRDSLKAEVDRERRAERISQGLGNLGVTRVRFI